MKIAEIWRYPVKSMAGERLDRVEIGPLGLAGDRIVHIQNAEGGLITSRTHPKFLGCKATLGADGEPWVDGKRWDDPATAALVESIGGPGAHLVPYTGAERFDKLAMSLVTDGTLEAFGHDKRRLRPNVIVEGVEGLEERMWERRKIRLGGAALRVKELRLRCVMTTYDPDTQVQDKEILRGIFQRFGGKLALDCFIVEAGEIAVGDAVALE